MTGGYQIIEFTGVFRTTITSQYFVYEGTDTEEIYNKVKLAVERNIPILCKNLHTIYPNRDEIRGAIYLRWLKKWNNNKTFAFDLGYVTDNKNDILFDIDRIRIGGA